ncbi:MAG: hypothetical protein ACOY71_11505 [Gemmatimonadota bacterium]
MSGRLLLLMIVLGACTAKEAAPPPERTAVEPAIADSLALTVSDSVSVWFSSPRIGRAAAGDSCVERNLVIHRGERRVIVPLLYTGEAPRLVNDTTIEAELWKDCARFARYRVDLRSGRPTPVR